MSQPIQELIKRYQAGEEVRGEIETALTAITDQVIKTVCGKQTRIYKPELGGWANLEPFTFNADDLERVTKKSLDDAIRTYDHNKGTFEYWLYKTLHDDLKNLKEEYRTGWRRPDKIKTIEEYDQLRQSIYGSPFDREILKAYNLPAELLEGVNKQKQDYICLIVNMAEREKELSNDTAAEIFELSRRQINRYKKEAKEILKYIFDIKMQSDDIPNILNEYGAKDETPRKAALNIKYGNID